MLKRSVKFAVVEDNEIFAKRAKEIIIKTLITLRLEEAEYVINCYTSGEQAIASVIEYDIVILDIELGGELNGFEVGERLKEAYGEPPLFIILTNSSDRGEESSDLDAKGYLTKISMEKKLPKHITRVVKSIIPTGGVIVKEGREEQFIYFDHIRFIQRQGSAIYIYTIDSMIITYNGRSIEEWKRILPSDQFIKPYKSNIINLKYVIKISENKKEIIMKHAVKNEKVKSSITKFNEIDAAYTNYLWKKKREQL